MLSRCGRHDDALSLGDTAERLGLDGESAAN